MSAKPFVFDTDVLIIGGGFSGSWAALTARQHVENVLIVDKGPRDWGGLGGMSGGDMIVKQPEFAAKDLVEELVYYYDGLCEQDVLEEILNQSYERFKDYEKMGHEFARDDSGRLMSIPQRGLELMRYYFYHPYGKGGAHTTQILNAELQRLNVQRIGRIEITDLVKDGDAVSGAVGFHAQSGTPCLFRAKAVILAAHNGGWKGSYLLNTCAGEGAALAYGAGASLRNMEFIENWNVPKLFAWEGQTGMLPYGARFLNGEGEDFMRRYSPKLGAKADPHYNVRGMAFEVRAGRGPIYFDTSTMSPEGVEIMTPTGGWMKLNDTKLKELGIDFFKSKTEWMPQVLTSFGGTVADKDGWSGVPGLFVAGRARRSPPASTWAAGTPARPPRPVTSPGTARGNTFPGSPPRRGSTTPTPLERSTPPCPCSANPASIPRTWSGLCRSSWPRWMCASSRPARASPVRWNALKTPSGTSCRT